MARSLADGHTKFTILTEEPADPAEPTAAELNAGIQAECNILQSDFAWSAADSDKVAEKALCDRNNSNALGAGNYNTAITLFRQWNLTTGIADPTADAAFDAVREKGTELWCYARETAKDATDAWATGDEIYLGAKVLTDTPQKPDPTGFIKRRVPFELQTAYEDIAVVAGA